MAGNRIFAIDVLNEKLLNDAIALKANTIVCNEKIAGMKIPGNIQLVNSEVYRIPGTFEAYAYNQSVITSLYEKCGDKMLINGINIRKAIPKMVYWTNYKIGYLHACIKDKLRIEDTVFVSEYLSQKRWRETVKYFRYFVKNNKQYIFGKTTTINTVNADQKVGLLVNDDFELGIFEYFIKNINASELIIFHYGNIDFDKYRFISAGTEKVDLSQIRKSSFQPLINPLNLHSEQLNIVNIAARNWQLMSSEIEQYRYIEKTGVKCLIINVGENLADKNLLPDIFKGKVKVYNTMNGMKSGEAHDGDVYFDKWFVWDEQMKSMLVRKCRLNPDALSVTGHLMKDFIKDYHFENNLGVSPDELKDKKVISLFSVRGNREEKQETFAYLFDLLEKDPSYFLFLRPHPLEKKENFLLPDSKIKNFHFVEYNNKNSKQTLYDQIFLSDLAIVFGSTVALECKWMNVPSVTFEKKGISNIYCIDDEDIKHAKSLNMLKDIIEGIKKRRIIEKKEMTQTVAGRMMEIINMDLPGRFLLDD